MPNEATELQEGVNFFRGKTAAASTRAVNR